MVTSTLTTVHGFLRPAMGEDHAMTIRDDDRHSESGGRVSFLVWSLILVLFCCIFVARATKMESWIAPLIRVAPEWQVPPWTAQCEFGNSTLRRFVLLCEKAGINAQDFPAPRLSACSLTASICMPGRQPASFRSISSTRPTTILDFVGVPNRAIGDLTSSLAGL